MYKTFWQTYVAEHSHHTGSGLTIHPGPLFAVLVCLTVLAAWAAFQIQSRCGECREWPVRCRCPHEPTHADRS